jgi:hypothetical protein
LEDAVIRYVRALDLPDLHAAFLRLWGTLEALTDTERSRVNYERTVKRVAFHYEDAELHRDVLQHLKAFRNENVHAGHRADKIETIVYQLKMYVENLIYFYMSNHQGFTSLDEALEFADLPLGTDELDRRIKLFGAARRYRTKRS